MKNISFVSILTKHHKKIITISIALFFIIFFVVNLFSLTAYPFIHSDEPWLSGLSRTVMDKQSFNTSEPFFDIYPRPIHGLRVIFVFIQMIFIKTLGYSIFSVRLISLIFASLSLVLIYKIIQLDFKNELLSILATTVVAFNIQFIMMSHTARQEAIILLGMLSAYYFVRTHYIKHQHLITASIIGICMGVHPNSFLIGCGIGIIYVYQYLNKKITLKQLLSFIGILIGFLTFFIVLSFIINEDFLNSYLSFGDSLGVINNDISRIQGLYYYYLKLYERIGGTYNLVNINMDLILLAISICIGSITLIGKLIRKRFFLSIPSDKIIHPFLMVIGINLGYLIIGRYNQTAIIFTIVFTYLTLFNIIKVYLDSLLIKGNSFNQLKKIIMIVLIALLALYQLNNTLTTITQTNYMPYETLENKIMASIPESSIVLGNLNMGYFFNTYDLYDYRNLAYLEKNQLTFKDYIEMNAIEYIILPEEMLYIYDSDGKWDILYGDLSYYDSMMTYINTDCTLINVFENPTYGMRISKYIDVYPWYTKIYKVNK